MCLWSLYSGCYKVCVVDYFYGGSYNQSFLTPNPAAAAIACTRYYIPVPQSNILNWNAPVHNQSDILMQRRDVTPSHIVPLYPRFPTDSTATEWNPITPSAPK